MKKLIVLIAGLVTLSGCVAIPVGYNPEYGYPAYRPVYSQPVYQAPVVYPRGVVLSPYSYTVPVRPMYPYDNPYARVNPNTVIIERY